MIFLSDLSQHERRNVLFTSSSKERSAAFTR